MKKTLKGLIVFIIVAAVTVSAQRAPFKAPSHTHFQQPAHHWK